MASVEGFSGLVMYVGMPFWVVISPWAVPWKYDQKTAFTPCLELGLPTSCFTPIEQQRAGGFDAMMLGQWLL